MILYVVTDEQRKNFYIEHQSSDTSFTVGTSAHLSEARLFDDFDDACQQAKDNLAWKFWDSILGSLIYVVKVELKLIEEET